MRYPELTDEEIERLIDAVGTALTTMKGDTDVCVKRRPCQTTPP